MVDKIAVQIKIAAKCFVMLQQLKTQEQSFAVHDRHGFTLVELIVVTAILGVLAAMALPTFQGYIKSAKVYVCATDIRTIDKAISAYVIDKNALPASLNDLGMGGQLDPWKRPYVYQNLSLPGADPLQDIGTLPLNLDYDLYSTGEDGESSPASGDPKNDDDIVRSSEGAYVGRRP